MLTIAVEIMESFLSYVLYIRPSNYDKFFIGFIECAKVSHCWISPAVGCPVFEIKVYKSCVGTIPKLIDQSCFRAWDFGASSWEVIVVRRWRFSADEDAPVLDERHLGHDPGEERFEETAHGIAEYPIHRASHMIPISCETAICKEDILGDGRGDVL